MSTADPLATLPHGTFPLVVADSARTAMRGTKRKADDEVVALRYGFKPASVTPDTPGTLEPYGSGRVLAFDLPSGGHQVFDVREESSKTRECVIVWDEDKQAFTLHALPTTLHLTVNRTASANRHGPPAFTIPVETKQRVSPEEDRRTVSGKSYARKQPPSVPASKAASPAPAPSPPSVPAPAPAVTTKKGKAAAKPRAAPKAKAAPKKAAPKKAAPKKAAPKKAAKKAAPATPNKIKSVEIIEDSDDDMDEFANMLGEAVEQAQAQPQEWDDDDDDDVEEEDDEDDELGGAQYGGYAAADDGEVEWI